MHTNQMLTVIDSESDRNTRAPISSLPTIKMLRRIDLKLQGQRDSMGYKKRVLHLQEVVARQYPIVIYSMPHGYGTAHQALRSLISKAETDDEITAGLRRKIFQKRSVTANLFV